ncbi:MAG: CoA pyrophosphatase [Propionivibrio sp.]|uniref:CoA pyrophosphatase n=1 Tax=Propionivibrio sp. TaxID=2212460 RepID=UPI001A5A370C|nr:CoA pyrophosphatase [Propionivibrio sp.]MBL8413997.1 CoA pyrophosphatase [Propionivibrio sp.]
MRKLETKNDDFVLTADAKNPEVLDLDRLRAVLYPAPSRTKFVLEDGVGDDELIPASVLFPIVLRESGPSVLLTQRTAHLKDHPGQISFPGGRVEPEDASSAHTALREAEEEIGLSSEHVEIVGYLPEYRTGTGYCVTPVVAIVTPPFELRPDPFEVAEIFEVPFAFLMDSANHQRHSMHHRGKLRHYFAMPYGEYFIWGATAGIIVTLSRALAPEPGEFQAHRVLE